VIPAKAIIGAVLLVLTAAALLAPPAAATKPCPVQYCTDPSGEYVLEVEPLSTSPLSPFAAYADCVWNAHVDFGDGTSADYVFDAAVGITGSHVFPTPGVTYAVTVSLSDGHHGETTNPCPDYVVGVNVRYRTPAEEADDPPGPGTPVDGGGTQPDPPPLERDASIPNALAPIEPTPTSPLRVVYWRHCGSGLLTHLVSCRKGRGVATAASGRLTGPGTVQVRGFACRLLRGPPRVVCRRGEQRILLPGGRRRKAFAD